MNQKEQRSAQELEEMIKARLAIGGVFVKVYADPVFGWHPTVITAPEAAVAVQQQAEKIASDLRVHYDLRR